MESMGYILYYLPWDAMSTGSIAGENKETEKLSFRLSFLSYFHTIVSRHEIEDEYIICDVQLLERVNTHPDAERRMIMRSVGSHREKT
jgi:hypothetical protein